MTLPRVPASMGHFLVALLVLAGCGSDLGPCDPGAAAEVVYTEAGLPAYAGQALLHGSCGHGAYCHGSEAEGAFRLGAPRGLELDIDPASYDGSVGDVERLREVQEHAFAMRSAIWREIERGTMPPGGAGGIAQETRPLYFRVGGAPLPTLASDEGRGIVRNWLACDLPVVERTRPRDDGGPSEVGAVVSAACRSSSDCPFAAQSRCSAEGACAPCIADPDCAHLEGAPLCADGRCIRAVEPTWASIHEVVIRPTCAIAFCHGDPDDINEGDLDLRGVAESYARLTEGSRGEDCRDLGMPLLTPGQPARSLLHEKLFARPDAVEDEAICGFRMPYAEEPLPTPWIDAIEAWIAAGAPAP